MLITRKSRIALGIVCMEKYNPDTHMGAEVYEDQTDRQKYASNRVTWLVRKVSGKAIL